MLHSLLRNELAPLVEELCCKLSVLEVALHVNTKQKINSNVKCDLVSGYCICKQYLCAVLSSNLVSQRLQVSSRRQHLRATFPKQQLLSELERAHNSLALLASLLCVALPG